jgi:hypothetical protein
VTSHFEEICTFARIRDKYAPKEITGVWCNIFGECERCSDNVFVQKIDVVSIGICWVVIEGKIASQHRIL